MPVGPEAEMREAMPRDKNTPPSAQHLRDGKAEQDHPDPRRSPSMHEAVESWSDTCACEPEPRWQREADGGEGEQPGDQGSRPGGDRD